MSNGIRFTLLTLLFLGFNAQSQETVSLAHFLEQVRDHNLDLKLETAKSNAADAKSIGINIPPPMVAITQMKEDNGKTTKGYEISQSIPFPTKLWGDKSARNYEAKTQEEIRLTRENEFLAQARVLYFSLWSTQERLGLLKQKKQILDDHVKLTRSTARSDSFASIHLLKAETDRDFLENDILSAEQKLQEKQSAVAIFMNADSRLKIQTEEPLLPSIPNIDSIEESHPLRALKFNVEHLSSRELELKSAWLPDFNFRYKTVGPSSMASRYNEVMIGVTVPFIFFWEPYSVSKQSSAQRIQAEFELEKGRRTTEADRVNCERSNRPMICKIG